MSYYTGPIFEISMDEFGSSVGGGGRYDEMVGKFIGQPVPAVGFSIGFERIVMLLLDSGFQVPGSVVKKAYLIDKKCSSEQILATEAKAMAERKAGQTVNVLMAKKNRRFQKDQLTAEGYTEIEDVYAN